MYSQSLQCVLCVESYNLKEHLPRVLVHCGHTLCTKCLEAIIQRPNASCPLDKTKFKPEYRTIDAFPINFALRDQIEESLGWEVCGKHGNKMEVFCLSDDSRLCLHCAFFEGHKCHNIKHTSEVEFELLAKKKELEKGLIDLSELEEVVFQKLESSKKSVLTVISDRFQELSFLLKAKRQELTTQVESVFQLLKEDHTNPFRSCMMDKIKKIENFENLLKSQDLFSVIKEQVFNFAYKEDQALNSYIEDLGAKLQSLTATLNENFALPVDFLTQLSIPMDEYKKNIHEFYSNLKDSMKDGSKDNAKLSSRFFAGKEEEDEETGRQDLKKELPEMNSKSKRLPKGFQNSLKVQNINGCLSIVADLDQSFNIIQLDDKVFDNVTEVKLRVRDWGLQEENIQVIKEIFLRLESVKSIGIYSTEQTIPDECLIQLFKGVFKKVEILTSISLDFKLSKIESHSLSYFSEKILKKAKKLESLSVNLNTTKVDKISHEDFFKSLRYLEKHLNVLELQLSHLDAEEDQLVNLFVQLPNVRKLVLGLGHTNINDRGLTAFAKTMLPSMKNLESLELRLTSTSVGNSSMELIFEVLHKITTLKHLSFNLSSTKVKPAMKNKIAQLEQDVALNLNGSDL